METTLAHVGAFLDTYPSHVGQWVYEKAVEYPISIGLVLGLLIAFMLLSWLRFFWLAARLKISVWRARAMSWRRPLLVRRICDAVTDLIDEDYLNGKLKRRDRIQAFRDLGEALRIVDLTPRRRYKKLPKGVAEKMKQDIKNEVPDWEKKLAKQRAGKREPVQLKLVV